MVYVVPKEIELKLIVLSEDLKSKLPLVLETLGVDDVKESWLVNTYFDTPDELLNRHRIALRIREKDGCFIQTLKTKGVSVAGVHQRGEWEWSLSNNQLDCSLLADDNWPKDVATDDLIPFFVTNFKRTSAVIELQGSRIELAIDDGYIEAGSSKVPLCEIELEIIEGEVEPLFDVAANIAAVLPVMLSDVSKAERGYRLGGGHEVVNFSYAFNCEGDYQQFVVQLITKNLSHWLYLFDRACVSCSVELLRDMQGVLVVLRELLASQVWVDSECSFSKIELFDEEIEHIRLLLGRFAHRRVVVGEVEEVLLGSQRAGILAIEVGRWLNMRGV